MGKLFPPINLKKWIEENRATLKPPVGNKLIFQDAETMVFISAGPNGRTDFHFNPTEEFFYQIEGDIFLKLWVDNADGSGGQFKDQWIREGEIFVLPANTYHSPQRPANTIGLVIEQQRPKDKDDALMWRCPKCSEKLYEKSFHLNDIVNELKQEIIAFFKQPELGKCKACGHQITIESKFNAEN